MFSPAHGVAWRKRLVAAGLAALVLIAGLVLRWWAQPGATLASTSHSQGVPPFLGSSFTNVTESMQTTSTESQTSAVAAPGELDMTDLAALLEPVEAADSPRLNPSGKPGAATLSFDPELTQTSARLDEGSEPRSLEMVPLPPEAQESGSPPVPPGLNLGASPPLIGTRNRLDQAAWPASATVWPDQEATSTPTPAPRVVPMERDSNDAATGLAPRAVARFQGIASPGLKIMLDATGSQGPDLRVRWLQTRGPAVDLGDPLQPVLSIMVPEASGELEFTLVVGNAHGIDSTRLVVPIETGGRKLTDPTIVADAGDNQIGVVGRQITLNGLRSEPRGQIGYRWIQLGGPRVVAKLEDGFIYSFVPTEPGVYRFALVVARGSEISEPAEVTVTVGQPKEMSSGRAVEPATASPTRAPAAFDPPGLVQAPPQPLPAPVAAEPNRPASFAAVEPVGLTATNPANGSTRMVARNLLLKIEEGTLRAPGMAMVFNGLADDLARGRYNAYENLMGDIASALQGVVPTDPLLRERWVQQVFQPLTDQMIREMLPTGLDLNEPQARSQPFTPTQRDRLAGVFREMAQGFRDLSR